MNESPLALARLGLPILRLDGKIPLPGTRGSHDATTHQDQIGLWMAEHDGNWGIATGHPLDPNNNLTVIDVDTKHNGAHNLTQLETLLGKLTPTLTIRTGTGGTHHYYKTPAHTPIKNSANKLAPGIDIRGIGGYVVAPGSTHPDTQQPYVTIRDYPIAELPSKWVDHLHTQDTTPSSVLEEDEVIVEGSRDRSLFEYACRLRSSGANPEEILTALTARNLKRVKPPLPQTDINRIAAQAAKYPIGERLTTIITDIAETSGLVTINNGVEAVITREEHANNQTKKLVRSLREWFATEDAETPYIIPGFLVHGGLGIIAGEPKTGKSWLVYHLMLCVAAGIPMPPYTYEPDGPKKVLLVANEGSQAGMKHRIAALANGLHINIDSIADNIAIIAGHDFTIDSVENTALLQHASNTVDLIIIDTLSNAWYGKEDSNDEMKQLIGRIRPIINNKTSVLLVHHLAKPSQDTKSRRPGLRMRGASALYGATDSGIYLTREPNDTTTSVETEQKDTAPAAPFTFSWPETTITASDTVTLNTNSTIKRIEPVKETVLEAMEKAILNSPHGITKKEIKDNVPGTHARKLEILEQKVASGEWVASTESRTNLTGNTYEVVVYKKAESDQILTAMASMLGEDQVWFT